MYANITSRQSATLDRSRAARLGTTAGEDRAERKRDAAQQRYAKTEEYWDRKYGEN